MVLPVMGNSQFSEFSDVILHLHSRPLQETPLHFFYYLQPIPFERVLHSNMISQAICFHVSTFIQKSFIQKSFSCSCFCHLISFAACWPYYILRFSVCQLISCLFFVMILIVMCVFLVFVHILCFIGCVSISFSVFVLSACPLIFFF